MDVVSAVERQAEACAGLGSPMYAGLLARCASDLAAGGPVAEVLAGHEQDPGPSALALRLLGSVHRLVLERRAGALAAFYPSVGGTWSDEGGWAAFRDLLAERPEDVRAMLDHPPQTNEVGRATALYGGLLQLPGDLPVLLREVGSSAGLNLLADRFEYRDDHGNGFGESGSAVRLDPAWLGRSLAGRAAPVVADRLGSDLAPVDASTTDGRLLLTAYTWPDQRARLERLRAAFTVLSRHPVTVRPQRAVDFVAGLELVEGTVTVLWHSVMWQYLAAEEQQTVTAALEALGDRATGTRRLAHLRAEPSRRREGADHEFLVRLRTWPEGQDRLLGSTVGHGLPTTWEQPG